MKNAAGLILSVIAAGVLLWIFSYIGATLAARVFGYEYKIEQVWLIMWCLTAGKIIKAEVNKNDND